VLHNIEFKPQQDKAPYETRDEDISSEAVRRTTAHFPCLTEVKDKL
jgi:hypothetical protein